MTWTVIVTRPAERAFRALPAADAARIRRVLEAMANDPWSGDVQKLKRHARRFRRRTWAWRILFEVDQEARRIVIAAILRRTTTTYR